jgi:hypothetical protein
MSFKGMLNAFCTIRKVAETQSPLSGQINDAWQDVAVNVRCRLDEASGQEIKTETGKYVKATHVLFIENATGGIDINEKEYEIVISENSYNILLIKDAGGHGHHKEILLQRVY